MAKNEYFGCFKSMFSAISFLLFARSQLVLKQAFILVGPAEHTQNIWFGK